MKEITNILEKEATVYISEKYKPDKPKYKNIVYVPDPFAENKQRIKDNNRNGFKTFKH